jgi:hypothetical protein
VAFRKKRNRSAEPPEAETANAAAAVPEEDVAPDRPGPRDASEIEEGGTYLDFGGLRIPALPGSTIRLEQDSSIKRIVAVTVLRDGASLQVRAFAAPRSGGMWEENRTSILEQVAAQSGAVEEVDGRYGRELHARLQVPGKDGAPARTRWVRFTGIDGPRWLVHAVFTSEAPGGPDWDALEEVLESIVVVRGSDAMPAGAMLTLRPPEQPPAAAAEEQAVPDTESLEPGARITEVR